MKIDRKEMLEILAKINPVAILKDAVDNISFCFTFFNDFIFVYNENFCILHPFKFDGVECSVPANEFYEVLKKIDEDEIDIGFVKDKFEIKSETTKANLKVLEVDLSNKISLIAADVKEIKKWGKLPDDFSEGISLCLLSTDKRLTDSYFNCIWVNGKNMISTDNYRVSRYTFDKGIDDSFFIPEVTANEIIKYDVKEYYKGETWIFFRTKDNVIFCLRGLQYDFPKLDYLFVFDGKNIKLPDNMGKIIEVSEILAAGDSEEEKEIEIKIENGEITCKGSNKAGWIEKVDKINSKIKLNIIINPGFMRKVINKTKIGKVGKNLIVFKIENFEHLIGLANEKH